VENVFAGSTSYRLVQSLPIPASAELTIFHVAALATVISEAAKDYSAFHHMCMWWAAIFLKAIASHLKAEPAPGPSYRHAGTIANIPVVTLDGTLVFAVKQRDLEGLVGDTGADEALRLALRNDVERMGLRPELTSTESITVRFLALARQTALAFETRLELDVESEKKLEESEKKLEESKKKLEESKKKLEESKKKLEESEKKLEEREREREERERELEKREREREERERELEKRERERELEETERQWEERQLERERELEKRERELEQWERKLEEEDRQLERERELEERERERELEEGEGARAGGEGKGARAGGEGTRAGAEGEEVGGGEKERPSAQAAGRLGRF
jgi:hypothetical protein